jgi:hypothetical protein
MGNGKIIANSYQFSVVRATNDVESYVTPISYLNTTKTQEETRMTERGRIAMPKVITYRRKAATTSLAAGLFQND